MIKHTPKPWRVARTSRGILQIRDCHDKCVAMFDWHKDRTADARLIASAPDLLEALIALVDDLGAPEDGIQANLMKTARIAIAKATDGET